MACRKRPIDSDQIEQMVNTIMNKIDKYGEGEVESRIVGELVMEELAKIDQVAYVRYASVYKDFSKPSDFGQLIAKIAHENK
jgi:transcriptional repressor NrdR